MSIYWIIGSIISYLLLSIKFAYYKGLSYSFRKLINILIPFILGGITFRAIMLLLPQSINLAQYIAGIGTALFYLILYPIINKDIPDRYRKISKRSRNLACLVELLSSWLILSLTLFFILKIFSQIRINDEHWLSIFFIPLKIIWLLPY
ncbi:MAG: hypothetical protein ACRCTJ_07505 [Brevinema sp.]